MDIYPRDRRHLAHPRHVHDPSLHAGPFTGLSAHALNDVGRTGGCVDGGLDLCNPTRLDPIIVGGVFRRAGALGW